MKKYTDLHVNDEFTLQKECDVYRPIYYAGASGDFNPIHIDPEFGKMVGLGTNILQGLCTYAWVSQAVTDYIGDPRRLKRLKVRFKNPVRPNDTVTIRGKIVSMDKGKVTCSLNATIQDGSEVISNGEAEIDLS